MAEDTQKIGRFVDNNNTDNDRDFELDHRKVTKDSEASSRRFWAGTIFGILDEVVDKYRNPNGMTKRPSLYNEGNEVAEDEKEIDSMINWRSTMGGTEADLEGMIEDLWSIQRGQGLTLEQRRTLTRLLSRFRSVFIWKDQKLGYTDLVIHKIYIGDNPPIKQKAYRLSKCEREVIMKETKQMLKDKIIEPSSNPWCCVH